MKESKLFKRLVTTFLVIVYGSTAVVLAGTISYVEVDKASVSYADLNLESEEGMRVLYRRLQLASNKLCSATPPRIAGSLQYHYQSGIYGQENRQCYRETLSNAVAKFDNEDLTRIHAG